LCHFGNVYGHGRNHYHALALPDTTAAYTTLTDIPFDRRPVLAACGQHFSIIQSIEHEIWITGRDVTHPDYVRSFEGTGVSTQLPTWTKALINSPVKQLFAGDTFMIFLTGSLLIFC
jgi:hypothetical protein